jgi:hypothetical protein
VRAGAMPKVAFTLDVEAPTTVRAELRVCSRPDAHTPDVTLGGCEQRVAPGKGVAVCFDFQATIDQPRYAFVCLMSNDRVAVHVSDARITGLLSLAHDKAQSPEKDIGVEAFELWLPRRRPGGHNLAVSIDPPIDLFAAPNLTNGVIRPTNHPNAWVAEVGDPAPSITLSWSTPQHIGRIELAFDADYDHPMESVLWHHPERAMPLCVRRYRILDDEGRVRHECSDNHQTLNRITFDTPVHTSRMVLEIIEMNGPCSPAAVFGVRCYRK